jgi:uncharacterized protein (TIGR02466 family)
MAGLPGADGRGCALRWKYYTKIDIADIFVSLCAPRQGAGPHQVQRRGRALRIAGEGGPFPCPQGQRVEETRLFYTPLWQASLIDANGEWPRMREAMLARIDELRRTETGVEKTNFGGWQSDDDLYKHGEFGWLIGRLMALANGIAPAFSPTRRFDDGLLWANVNRRGDFNAVHTHPDAVLSGVVYLRYARPEQGVIQFFDAREGSPTSHWRCYMRLPEMTPLTREVHTVVPREGNVLFFPGWLRHWVTPNQTDEERVSVSFNLRLN